MLKSQLNEAMLAKALEEPPKPRGAARVALLIVSIIRAIREVLRSASEENWQLGSETRDALALIRALCSRFPVFANQLRLRRGTRRSLVIRDEYDVQNLLHSLLLLHFEDVRAEEWTPSYAGKGSRTDFLLKREEIVIEMKMTRDGLDQKKLGDELIIDKERYRVHPNCKSLVCFVYDPDHRCSNPTALEDDLSQQAPFRVAVIVAPNDGGGGSGDQALYSTNDRPPQSSWKIMAKRLEVISVDEVLNNVQKRLEVSRVVLQECTDSLAAHFFPAVRPIYLRKNNGVPRHIATSTLLEVSGAKYLITAAHVIDDCKRGSLLAGGDTDLVHLPIAQPFWISPGSAEMRDSRAPVRGARRRPPRAGKGWRSRPRQTHRSADGLPATA